MNSKIYLFIHFYFQRDFCMLFHLEKVKRKKLIYFIRICLPASTRSGCRIFRLHMCINMQFSPWIDTNSQRTHRVQTLKEHTVAWNSLQLSPIIAALYTQHGIYQTLLITTRYSTGQITKLYTRQTYRLPRSWIINVVHCF